MADIQATGTTLSPPYALASLSSSEGVAVPVSLANIPEALTTLNRIIQINASVSSVSESAIISLASALGNISVIAAQQVATTEKQKIIQKLLTLIGSKETVSLSLQPGSPPSQGTLIIGNPSTLNATQNTKSASNKTVVSDEPITFKTGAKLKAIVISTYNDGEKNLSTQSQNKLPHQSEPQNSPVIAPKNTPDLSQKTNAPQDYPRNHPPTSKPIIQEPIIPDNPPRTYNESTETAPPALKDTPKPPPANNMEALDDINEHPFLMLRSQQETPKPHAANAYQQILKSTPDLPTEKTDKAAQTKPLPAQKATPEYSDTKTTEPIKISEKQILQKTDNPKESLKTYAADEKQAGISHSPKNAPNHVDKPITPPPITAQKNPAIVPGKEVSIHIISIPQHNTEGLPINIEGTNIPPAINSQTQPEPIIAKVSGHGTNGQIILSTKNETLFVKDHVSAPIGTTVIISIEEAKAPLPLTLPQQDDERPKHFKSLPQLIEATTHTNEPILQYINDTRIPQPSHALHGALLFLLSAFKSGNIKEWLGSPAVTALASAGKTELINTLTEELSTSTQTATDNVVGHWRSYPIPIYVFPGMQEVMLYVHHDRSARKENEQNSPSSNKIRFLIDMKLSKLGAMQVDGFSQPKKLDMVLRSENKLPETLYNELRHSYSKILDIIGYSGSIGFQMGRENWTTMQTTPARGILT